MSAVASQQTEVCLRSGSSYTFFWYKDRCIKYIQILYSLREMTVVGFSLWSMTSLARDICLVFTAKYELLYFIKVLNSIQQLLTNPNIEVP